MNLLTLFLIVTTFSLSSFAKEVKEKEIRNSIYDVENNISKTIEKKIIQFVGIDQIWISAQIEVDMPGLREHISSNVVNRPIEKKKYLELPGLNLTDAGAAVKDQEENKIIITNKNNDSQISPNFIIAFATGIKITVYNKVSLDRKVERVIRSLIEEKLSSLKIKTEVNFDHRKAKILDEKDFNEGSKVRFEPESFAKSFQNAVTLSFQNFLDGHVLSPIKWTVFISVLLGALLFGTAIYFITKSLTAITHSLGALSKAIAQRESHSSSIQADTLLDMSQKNADTDLTVDNSENEKARQKIIEIYESYQEVVTNFFLDSMNKKNFQEIWSLGQILGEKLIIENARLSKHKNYKAYNKYLRTNLFFSATTISDQRLYQKLMSLMLYPDVYVFNNIKFQLASLGDAQLGQLFLELSPSHKGIASDMLDPLRLAFLMNQSIISSSDVSATDENAYELDSVSKLDHKITTFVQSFDSNNDSSFSFLFYLNSFQYNEYLASMQIDSKFQFENLFFAKEEIVNEVIQNYSVDKISSLLPMVSDPVRDHIFKLLPEIKLARVMQSKKVMNNESQIVIAQIFHLILSDVKEEFIEALHRPTEETIRVA
jgi:hypothetical protein